MIKMLLPLLWKNRIVLRSTDSNFYSFIVVKTCVKINIILLVYTRPYFSKNPRYNYCFWINLVLESDIQESGDMYLVSSEYLQ
jgi:hypothetical protein